MSEARMEFFCTDCARSTLKGDRVSGDYCSECGGEINYRCTGQDINSGVEDTHECGKRFEEYREQSHCDRCGKKLYWG